MSFNFAATTKMVLCRLGNIKCFVHLKSKCVSTATAMLINDCQMCGLITFIHTWDMGNCPMTVCRIFRYQVLITWACLSSHLLSPYMTLMAYIMNLWHCIWKYVNQLIPGHKGQNFTENNFVCISIHHNTKVRSDCHWNILLKEL